MPISPLVAGGLVPPARGAVIAEPGPSGDRAREVTDRMLITGPRHLRAILDEYDEHCNQHRPHRARSLRPPDHDASAAAPVTDLAAARMQRRKILGGLIHQYERAA